MQRPYDPLQAEAKWQQKWEEAKTYSIDLKKAKKPYYTHVMFPYPSGDKLHVGHWYNFGPADSFARFMRMQGHDVFSPMGFDAFGLPAENYAIKTGIHPDASTKKNVETMIKQLKRIGCMYDWDRMVNTSHPEYYKWTQWLFLQMFKNGLAYKKQGNVNFCPSCQTVLANEQVWEGKCERCETEVVQKALPQWYWKTTQYSDALIDGLDGLDWPEKTKTMQRNWIGRKSGINLVYEIDGTHRGLIGPMNWPVRDRTLTGDIHHTLTGDLNRRLTDEWKRRIHSPRTCHLVFPTFNRIEFLEDPAWAANLLRILTDVADRHDIAIHEACAMPEHVHLLVTFASDRHLERDIAKKLKGASARIFLKMMSAEGHLWAEGKHFEDVNTLEQFEATTQYIRNNPTRDALPPHGRVLSLLPLMITCFTTRPDTNFGATFVVLAPEHSFVSKIVEGELGVDGEIRKAVGEYVDRSMKKTELERQEEGRKKTGAFTGFYAINNLNGRRMPIWVSDFVLAGFGTGAVVGVPGHDKRDFEFAQQFGIDVIRVVVASDGDTSPITKIEQVQEEEGTMVNSDFLNELPIMEAKEKIMDHISNNGWGERVRTYRLRDWLLSRQRYWGAPIPIVYDPDGNPHPIPEKHLPWTLPTDVEFKPKGESPLRLSKEFIARTEKIFGKGWRPEFDTMDTFVCSSYYSLMYLGAEHKKGKYTQRDLKEGSLVDPALEKKWMPVSMYIGGPEHACMHLIYARFVMMALKDFGFVSHSEPFKKLVHQGLITNKGAKMSKSKGNVVSPDAFVDRYGADVFRMYLMFMGPFTDGGDWNDAGIRGISRFVQRVWRVIAENADKQMERDTGEIQSLLHKTIKKVTEEVKALRFNTAISALMELLNALEKEDGITHEVRQTVAKLLAPFAPHLAEELWEKCGGKGFIIDQAWPTHDPALLVSDTMTIVVQVNGKVRGELTVATNATKESILNAARELPNVQKYLTGAIRKEIYVPGRLVNVVV